MHFRHFGASVASHVNSSNYRIPLSLGSYCSTGKSGHRENSALYRMELPLRRIEKRAMSQLNAYLKLLRLKAKIVISDVGFSRDWTHPKVV